MKQRKKRKTKAVRKFTNGFFYFRKKPAPCAAGLESKMKKRQLSFEGR